MAREAIHSLLEQVESMQRTVASLSLTLRGEVIDDRDRQYLSRCFELLDMELAAITEYLGRLRA